MKKTNNKGFSLVELIIVIAIMAILAGAIAPALIRYIDKSRKSNDVSSCKTIKTAVETAMSAEDVYAYLTTPSGTNTFTLITITPGTSTTSGGGVDITLADASVATNPTTIQNTAETEIGTNIGENTPKLKYKKAAKSTVDNGNKPTKFFVMVNPKGTVYVAIGTTAPTALPTSSDPDAYTAAYLISPDVCSSYQ